MSTGTTQNLIKLKAPPRKSKAGRPTTAWQAWDRWGLVGRRDVAADRKPPPAYTAEDHEADVAAGRADAVTFKTSNCPRDRPHADCLIPPGSPMRVVMMRPRRARRRPTEAEPNPPTRWVEWTRWSCVECRYFGEYVRSQRFFREWGDHGLGYNRPSSATRAAHVELAAARAAADAEIGIERADVSITPRESWQVMIADELRRAARAQFVGELYGLLPYIHDPRTFAGSLSIELDSDRYAVHLLAGRVRHWLARYSEAICPR